MRQDKAVNEDEGITSNYFATCISGFIDSMITIDPHLHRRHSLSEIYTIPCTTLHSSVFISSYIKEQISNPVLIGPDSESEQWVSEVAKNSNSPYLVLEKERLKDNIVKITVPFLKNFRNHTPVLVDDIISTAGTMIETIKHLNQNEMKPAICIGIHAVFAENAYQNLISNRIGKVVTCNTILHESNDIDVSPLIIGAIKKLV
jgi:ribose-phosphate pyrophosphokinase